MEPARIDGDAASSLRKWGPLAAIVVVAAVVVGIVVATSGGGDDDTTTAATTVPSAPSDTTDPSGTTTPAGTTDPSGTTTSSGTTAPDDGAPDAEEAPAITYPLSFSDATEQGVEVDWDERCDVERGTLAVKDFFAPECYAPFEGDNGGGTAPGVTAESIRVVLYQGPDDDPVINYITDAIVVDDSNAEEADTINGMLAYYATYYELYGRSIDLVVVEGSGIASDEVAARADAVRIAEDIRPFAVVGGPALTNAFADELAARDVLCISCTPGQAPEWYAERDPYVFSLATGTRQSRAHVREFVAKQLVGGVAEHAGEAFRASPRTFGVVYLESSGESKTINDEFVAGLRDDGAEVVEVLPYVLDPGTIQAQASQIVQKLKASQVTTVILVGDPVGPRDMTREATAQEYFPEWVIAAPALVDTTAFARTYDQEQWVHAFGVTHLAARTRPEARGYYALYSWFHDAPPPAPDTIEVFMPGWALLHAVLQGVGPDLTPATFRDALFAGEGTPAAISQPFLDWGDTGIWPETDYNGVDDATLIWWDPTATGPDEIRKDGTGMYQYVDAGRRYLPGDWPTEDRLFDPEGAVTIYQSAPPGEEPPDYPVIDR